MIAKVQLIIQEMEYTPERMDETDPANILEETFNKVGTESVQCPLNIPDIKYWFYNDESMKVCLKDGSVILLNHTLKEFEDILRKTLGISEELLTRQEKDILEYLVRNNDYGLSSSMFEG